MTTLYIIDADGSFVSVETPTPPSYAEMREHLKCDCIQDVSVLFQGREAHMFVDEDGLAKDLPINHRASRVYSNVLLHRHGRATYDDMNEEPSRAVVISHDRPIIIVGTAFLWAARLPATY